MSEALNKCTKALEDAGKAPLVFSGASSGVFSWNSKC